MFKFSENRSLWLLPVILILFILEIVTLPLALNSTYSGRSENPEHLLVYTPGRLTWDSGTGIDQNGAAIMRIFSDVYGDAAQTDVDSADGNEVIAPGTDGFNIVRLKNNVGGSIKYTAVLYSFKSSDAIPVKASLSAPGAIPTSVYPLPAGVSHSQVISAVSGYLAGGAIEDFDTSWFWTFYESDARDTLDTGLGNAPIPDQLTLGLYIVVEDDNSYIAPNIPKTGDENHTMMYASLMLIALIMAGLLFIESRRREKCED